MRRVKLIAATTTAKGLSVTCRLDRRKYPVGERQGIRDGQRSTSNLKHFMANGTTKFFHGKILSCKVYLLTDIKAGVKKHYCMAVHVAFRCGLGEQAAFFFDIADIRLADLFNSDDPTHFSGVIGHAVGFIPGLAAVSDLGSA